MFQASKNICKKIQLLKNTDSQGLILLWHKIQIHLEFSPVIDCGPIQGVPCLSSSDSWIGSSTIASGGYGEGST